MASGGYPGSYQVGKKITGLPEAAKVSDAVVFHAATEIRGNEYYTCSGRVLSVTATGVNLEEAARRSCLSSGLQDSIRGKALSPRRRDGRKQGHRRYWRLKRGRSCQTVRGPCPANPHARADRGARQLRIVAWKVALMDDPGAGGKVTLIEIQTTSGALGLRPGVTRENLTTLGIRLADLASGRLLRAGRAVLEVTVPCEPCAQMDAIREGLKGELQGRRGVLCRVVEGGLIRRGDALDVIEPVATRNEENKGDA